MFFPQTFAFLCSSKIYDIGDDDDDDDDDNNDDDNDDNDDDDAVCRVETLAPYYGTRVLYG